MSTDPSPFLHVRISLSKKAMSLMDAQGIDIDEAVQVVRHFQESWPSNRPGRLWYRGDTPDGMPLKVLVSPIVAGSAVIIAAYRIR